MNLDQSGTVTSHSEVTGIGAKGFWLLVDDREYFIPFEEYPAFNTASVAQVFTVQRIGPDQFYWPDLDIEIELSALDHPEIFPLVYHT
jgi:hypothetical protein